MEGLVLKSEVPAPAQGYALHEALSRCTAAFLRMNRSNICNTHSALLHLPGMRRIGMARAICSHHKLCEYAIQYPCRPASMKKLIDWQHLFRNMPSKSQGRSRY
jgi:hypothetical protein